MISFNKPSLTKLFPFLRWTRTMTRQSATADLLAGLTGAAIILPQGVAFAVIAGMPPEYGLYAGMVPAIIAALFGSSRHLVSGPTTAASIVMFSSLSVMAVPGSEEYISLAITLAFMVGILQLVLGFARMGVLVNFVSHSVVVGFTTGAACLIAAKQAKTFIGLELPESEYFWHTLGYLWDHWDAYHPLVTLVGASTVLTVVLARKFAPRFPGMVAAMVVGSLVAWAANAWSGVEDSGIEMIGALPAGLPPLSAPVFSVEVIRQLMPVALAMTLLALTEALSIARSIAIRSGQSIEPNQEFIGQGLSNVVGSFFSSYVSTGSFNRSGANYDAGAKSPLAAITAGVLLVALLLVVAPLTAYLPMAAVSGLLIVVAWRLINFEEIRNIIRSDEKEAAVFLVTFLGTLFLNLEDAILIGVITSLVFFLRKTSRPKVQSRVPHAETRHRKFGSSYGRDECPQLKILRIEDSLYFGSVAYVGELLRLYRERYASQKHLFLLTKGINQVDYAGAELLLKEARARRAMGGQLYMYRLKDTATRVLNRGGFMEVIGEDTVFDTKEDAILGIFQKLDKEICKRCDKRIFLECKTVEYVAAPGEEGPSAEKVRHTPPKDPDDGPDDGKVPGPTAPSPA